MQLGDCRSTSNHSRVPGWPAESMRCSWKFMTHRSGRRLTAQICCRSRAWAVCSRVCAIFRRWLITWAVRPGAGKHGANKKRGRFSFLGLRFRKHDYARIQNSYLQFMIKRRASLLFLILIFAVLSGAHAQDELRAAWQATNFDITVNSLGGERALNARAVVTLRNVGRGAGATLSLRINSKAEIKSVGVGGATAIYRSVPESRGGAQRLTITLPNAIGPNETVTATIEYRLPLAENSGLAAISPVASQFLPLSLWYPSANTPFAVRGADYAPFRLTVNGANAISSGTEKSTGGNSLFEQSLNGQPFFVAGAWDRVEGSGNAKGITAFVPKGANADEQKHAEALIALANDARTFYAGMFGPAPAVPLRLVAVNRGAGFDDAGTVLVSEGAFRRKKV